MTDYKQAEFEKHATEDLKVSVEKGDSGEYVNPHTLDCWDAWKASRASKPVNFIDWKWVELPPSLKEHYAFDVLESELAKVGVKVRPSEN